MSETSKLQRYVAAVNNLRNAVRDLAEAERLLRLQDKNLALAEADGDLIMLEDWDAAVRAVVVASADYEAAERDMEAGA
jgi:hypothetical protein